MELLFKRVIYALAVVVLVVIVIGQYSAPSSVVRVTHSADSVAPAKQIVTYPQQVDDTLAKYQSGFGELSSLFADAGVSPNLIRNERWKNDIRVIIAKFNEANSEVLSLNPPPKYESAHREFSFGAMRIGTGVSLLNKGLNSHNIETIETSMSAFTDGVERMVAATIEMGYAD